MIWITGKTGDLGQELFRALSSIGHSVAKLPRFDITDRNQVRAAFRQELERSGPPEALFHCAVFVELGKTENNLSHTCAVNELGTVHVLETLVELGLSPWCSVVGTGHIYAPQPKPIRLSETHPLNPRSAYALSKYNAEKWALFISEKTKLRIFTPRVFSFTAPWQRSSFVIPRLASTVKSAISGSSIQTGWLEGYRDFLDIRDVATALTLAMKKELTGAYNICNGEPIQIRSALDRFIEFRSLKEKDFQIQIESGRARPDDIEWLIGDPTKFTEATHFKPSISWQQTLTEIWNKENLS